MENLAAILQSNPKTIEWKSLERILLTYHPSKKGAANLDGLLRKALHRACVNQSGQRCVTLVLKKLTNLSLPERVQFASIAVQCKNMAALQAIIYDDANVLYYLSNGNDDYDDENDHATKGGVGGATLLHLACERYGWNKEIKFILEEILKHNDNCGVHSAESFNHKGLFHETEDTEMPLTLALHAGSELPEIIYFLRSNHASYLQANLDHVSKIIAEYWHDMELLSDLIRWYDGKLLESSHRGDGSSPLNHACYYQNQPMILFLLNGYLDYHRCNEEAHETNICLWHVQKRLMSQNDKRMSPLGHLILSVGDADAENAWRCIDCCVGFFADFDRDHSVDKRSTSSRTQQQQFPILHSFLAHTWDHLLMKKNCVRIIDQVVQRFEIDVCSIGEEFGNTLLSIVIDKMATGRLASDRKKNQEVSLQILDYFLHAPAAGSIRGNRRPATTRDRSGRLPLHLACDLSLRWKMGLERIVNANMSALELFDPRSGLPPFALCAIGPKSELDSIYTLLRLHPGCIDSVLKRSQIT
mmetsp:Transcript_23598/g.55912  ORF Transcript_23598/g.55912 Transcript_23598/m.55912 type:complete len:529 (-) Transcript_23598:1562-3148(-)